MSEPRSSLLARLPVPDRVDQVRPVRLAYVAAVAAFATALYANFNAFVLAPHLSRSELPAPWNSAPLVFGALYLAALLLLLRRHFLGGRLVLLFASVLQVVSLARIIGVETGTTFLALIPILGSVLLFSRLESRWRWLSLALTVGVALLIHLPSFPRDPIVVLDSSAVPLARFLILCLAALLVVSVLLWNDRLVTNAQEELQREKQRSEELLLNVLPEPVAERLKRGVNPLADRFEHVTVLFADIVGFTSFAADNEPEEVVSVLNEIFSGFDDLADQFGVEKIKTIGDAYMIGSGLPAPRHDHAKAAAEIALGMLAHVRALEARRGFEIEVRIGIHSGRVVAGVIGQKKFSYDLWGDTVNVASRLEASGSASRIHVSDETKRLLEDGYDFEPCGETVLRGRGTIETHFLVGRKA